MKQYFTILMMLLTFNCTIAQSNEIVFTDKNFDTEFFNYEPIQKDGVSKSSFEHGKMILSETKKALKNNLNNYNVAHYWNIATAFSTLKEKNEYINLVFLKAVKSEGICEYFESFKNVKNHFSKDIPDIYNKEQKKCFEKEKLKTPLDLVEYSNEHGFDLKLISLISEINLLDQKYRVSDYQKNKLKQIEIDKKNQILIDSLYNQYNSYIGVSMVGKRFDNVMWAVIQHSNPDMMEKYIPIVHKAVENNEIKQTPLKMLIDRFYGLKYGYQIFGSQNGFGFKMADNETRNKIIKQYDLN